jgi:foldase protein PrsA
MKKWIMSVSLAAGVIGLAGCSGDGAENSDVVAETKAGDVTQEELYSAMKEKFSPQMQQALQELVYSKVLAEEYKVSKDEVEEKFNESKDQLGPQFEMFLSQYNLTEDSFKDYLKLQLLQEKAATADIKISDKELKEYYENWKPDIEVRHILVDDEKTAKEVKQKLADGGKFEELATEYSKDPGSAQNGGSLGWVDNQGRQNFVPAFTEALDKLEVNKVSEPIKSEYGYHIIEITDKKEKKSFDEMKDALKKELKLSKVTPEKIQEAMKREIEKADLNIQDKDLKKTFDQVLNPPTTPEGGEAPATEEEGTNEEPKEDTTEKDKE